MNKKKFSCRLHEKIFKSISCWIQYEKKIQVDFMKKFSSGLHEKKIQVDFMKKNSGGLHEKKFRVDLMVDFLFCDFMLDSIFDSV
jgi:hypothetical protein